MKKLVLLLAALSVTACHQDDSDVVAKLDGAWRAAEMAMARAPSASHPADETTRTSRAACV